MPREPKTEQICQQLFSQCQTLMLATASETGQPHASYAPFVQDDDGAIYIFISGLARHTRNIAATECTSCMLIEDEAASSQSFARLRLTFDARTVPIARDSAEWKPIIKLFQNRFGKLVDTLRSLADFTLIRLDFKQAVLVKGFGQAYTVSVPDFTAIDHLQTGV